MPIATNPDTGEVVFLSPAGQWEKAQTAVNPQTREMMAFDGKDWQPVTTHGKGILGYIDDAVRSVANGATFGFADEIAAKANSLLGSGTYEENVAKERARDAAIPAAVSIPGQIAGGVGTSLAAAPATAAAAVASGISKLPSLARSVLAGVGAGAAYGAGNADDGLANRAVGALEGGAIGGVVGGAAHGIVQGVKGVVAPQSTVANQLGRALERDQITPETALSSARSLSADRPGVATLADVGGENVKGLLERVAQTPGAGRTIVVPFLTERQTQQMARVSDDLSSLTGTNKTALAAINDTIAERSAEAKPLYDKAMNFNARENLDVAKAWQNATESGWGKTILSSRDFRKNIQSEYGIKDPADAPLMVQIDAWKKVADELVNGALQRGKKNTARVISSVRDSVVDTLDAANPAYQQARAAWAGPSQYISAIEQGKQALNPKMGADEMHAIFTSLNDSEKEAFRVGLVSAIRGKMASDPAKMADMTKYLRSPQMKDKISTIMPTPEAAASWINRLGFETSASSLTGRALGNSATARRIAEMDEANGVVGDLVLEMATGGGGSLFKKLIMGAPAKVRDTLRSRSDKLLAETLTDPEALQNLQSILDRAQSAYRAGSSRGAIGAATTGVNAELVPAIDSRLK